MKIAIFSSAFYPHVGGVEELTRQLAHSLQDRGDQPVIVTNRWPKNLPPFEHFEGLPVRRVVFRVPELTLRQLVTSFLFGALTLRQLTSDLRTDGVDLIHIQCVSSNSYYAVRIAKSLGLPLVVTLQGELSMDAGGLFKKSAFARNLMHESLRQGDAVTACSAQTLQEAEEFFGKPFGQRAKVVYNGIRRRDFGQIAPYKHARAFILAIGRHVPQKGFDVLLRAFSTLKRKGETEIDLILAGDGPQTAHLKDLAFQLGIAANVKFTGRVDRHTAAELFAGCQFFVLPSLHEPMGIVNLEAMASGKAVLATKVGGVPELVQDNVQGLLVPAGDERALIIAMDRLIKDSELRERLGRAGRVRSAEFEWSNIAEQYASVYESLVPSKTSIASLAPA